MGAKPQISRDDAVRAIAEIERALEEGYLIPGALDGGNHIQSAVGVAAARLGVARATFRARAGTPNAPGIFERRFGLKIDWSKYRPKSPEAAEPATDPIELRRLKDRNAFLETSLKDAERRTVDAEARARDMLGLTAEPLRAQLTLPKPDDPAPGGTRTVILHLSDIHYGEVVLLEEMDGLNRYDAKVAEGRLGRFFSHSADLMTKHWKGPPPDEIVLCLGGDMISGNLHPELEQTNEPAIPSTVRQVGEHIAGGIIMLRNEIKRPIRVYCVPGNHGRSTPKPQSKKRSASSWDLLVADFAEAVTRGAKLKEVYFYKAQSPDCYFSTYGFHWLLTHGDAAGFRGGGTGFIGAMATIVKAHRKLVDTSWRSGKPVHYVLTAHHHTTGRTSFGWANGSLIGYGEFARDLRADPEGARQNMLVVHPRHGVINHQELHLGDPAEGSLYAGPATVVRPQWDGE